MCPTRTVGTIGIRRRISFLLTVLSFLAADGPFGSVFNRLVIADDELNPAKNHVVQVMMGLLSVIFVAPSLLAICRVCRGVMFARRMTSPTLTD